MSIIRKKYLYHTRYQKFGSPNQIQSQKFDRTCISIRPNPDGNFKQSSVLAQTDLRAAAKLDPPAPPATAFDGMAAVVDGCTAAVDRILAEEGDDVGVVAEVIDDGVAEGAGGGGGGAGEGGGIAPGGSIC